MDSHGHDPHPATEPREFSHPVLWTAGLAAIIAGLGWVFFHQIAAGREAAKGEPRYAMPKPAAGPDHQALIADRSQAVLDRGEIVYGKNCASCHGAGGDTNPANIAPVPRQFRTEALQNKLGNGPYAWYKVLTDGYGSGMPGFRNLSPEDRYAVTHFVRETWVKPNAAIYVADDAADTAKQIPAKSAGGGAEAAVDPAKVLAPAAVLPVMARLAAAQAPVSARISVWLDRAAAAAPGDAGVARLRQVAERRPGQAAACLEAAVGPDPVPALARVLAAGADPLFATMSTDDLRRLAAHLVASLPATGATR